MAGLDASSLAVAGAAVVAFLPALGGGFVWDDAYYVRDNHAMRGPGIAAIAWAFRSVVLGNYQPLTLLSLALDQRLFGPGPFVFHLTNILLHAVNALLVHRLLLALSGRRDAAWAGALLWAVHPLRVESVAWISARKDVLYVLFFLGALLAYVRHARADGRPGPAYFVSLGLFLLSLLSKGMAVSLSLVLPLVDLLLRRRLTARSAAEKVPFFALSIVFGLVAIRAQAGSGAIPEIPDHGILGQLGYACYALVFYLVKTVAPAALSCVYPYPGTTAEALPAAVWLAILAGAALGAATFGSLRVSRAPAFGAGFYLATVALVLQVLPVGGAVAADRYTYLPAVGVSWLAGLGYARLRDRTAPSSAGRWTTSAGIVLLVASLGALSWGRCAVWQDGLALWNDVIAKHPDVAVAYQNRGVARAAAGDKAGALKDYDHALRLDPRQADAYGNRANAKADLGDREGALLDYREAIRLHPRRAEYRFNLALIEGEMGRWTEAIDGLGEAIRLDPYLAPAYVNRALALARIGRFAEARADAYRAQGLGYPMDPGFLRMLDERGP